MSMKTCPLCGNNYDGYPALSRVMNEDICSNCGTREALVPQTIEGFVKLWADAYYPPPNAMKQIVQTFAGRS